VAHRLPGCRTGRFLGWFVGLIVLYQALVVVPWIDRHLVLPVLELSAQGASSLLQWAGQPTRHEGVVIRGSRHAVAVRRGCDPLDPLALFGAAVLAFPAPLFRKLMGLAIGAGLMFGANLIRIASLYLTAGAGHSWFQPMHEEWWPAVFIMLAGLGWLAWSRWAGSRSFEGHA
jgi:exosortase/archaeosortase family protein